MSKRILTLLLIVLLSGMFACEDVPDTPTRDSEEVEEIDMSEYESIYVDNRTEAYPINPAVGIHMSAHGYKFKKEQGYNNWFYQSVSNGKLSNLYYDESNSRWGNDAAYISESLQVASSNIAVAKSFKAKAAGNVTISGNVRAHDSKIVQNEFYIALNGEKVYPSEGNMEVSPSDKYGLYFEFVLDINENDIISFVTVCGATTVNPSIIYGEIVEKSLHFDFVNEYFSNGSERHVGDVHPFYYNGKMYMYYLKTDGTYSSALLETTDFFNYTEATIQRVDPKPTIASYYVLGILPYQDKFISYFGASATHINGSISDDLYSWKKHETLNIPKVTYTTGRDPYIFYDEDVDRYRIIYTAYYSNKRPGDFDAALALKTSKSNNFDEWEETDKEMLRYDNAGASGSEDPEVSQMMKIGNRWYLFASIYGRSVHGVGGMSYWIGDENTTIDNQEWLTKEEHFLDGEDLCAAQIVEVNNKYYMFGWVPARANSGLWGGAINIAREIYQKEDGTLATRLDPYMAQMINKGMIYKLKTDDINVNVGDVEISENQILFKGTGQSYLDFQDYNEIAVPNTYSRFIMETSFNLENNNRAVGGVKLSSSNSKKIHVLCIDKLNREVYVMTRSAQGTYKNASIKLNLADWSNIKVNIIIEDNIVDIFVNDEYSLSARILDTNESLGNVTVALFGNKKVKMNGLTIYKLANSNNLNLYD